MERKSLEKTSILIYPIRHSKTLPKSPEPEKENSIWLKLTPTELLSEKCQSKKLLNPIPSKKGEKRCNLQLNLQKLSVIRECKSLSPKIRINWLDNFISTIGAWDKKNKQVEELEKDQFKIRSSIANILKSVDTYRKMPINGHKFKE